MMPYLDHQVNLGDSLRRIKGVRKEIRVAKVVPMVINVIPWQGHNFSVQPMGATCKETDKRQRKNLYLLWDFLLIQ